ncbi:MAG: PEGA domain-containing protein [Deltaproteobacteria bacterium]|nr:PEGA domain-containing protein [Deltaproteobacteria bacterium]MBT8466304.1 PEGA domain-containing protein [Deltaproteobacteria bacterium]NND27263.1 PEGA domain-containing protein [Myxococcales bacterium]NNK41057.1 PEGA domain-containing protein [Myxococcales bacterium]
MRRFTAALLSLAVVALGCAGANGQGQGEAPDALSSNETTGGELSQGAAQPIQPEAADAAPSQASIERRIHVARRLYRDLAFQASLDELRRAQKELEVRLDAQSTYPSLDDLVLMRALDELALGNQQAARAALRQAVILRPERISLDPAEFAPGVRAEYERVRDELRREAPLPLATESRPEGAELELDGRPAGLTPMSVRLHDGRHYLVFRSPGYLAAPRIIDVDGAPLGVLRVELEPLGPVFTGADASPTKPLVRKWWFWTVIGVAVVGASLGLYFGLRKAPETQLVIARPAQ